MNEAKPERPVTRALLCGCCGRQRDPVVCVCATVEIQTGPDSIELIDRADYDAALKTIESMVADTEAAQGAEQRVRKECAEAIQAIVHDYPVMNPQAAERLLRLMEGK